MSAPNELLADIPSYLPRLRTRTLIVHGSRDPAISPAPARFHRFPIGLEHF